MEYRVYAKDEPNAIFMLFSFARCAYLFCSALAVGKHICQSPHTICWCIITIKQTIQRSKHYLRFAENANANAKLWITNGTGQRTSGKNKPESGIEQMARRNRMGQTYHEIYARRPMEAAPWKKNHPTQKISHFLTNIFGREGETRKKLTNPPTNAPGRKSAQRMTEKSDKKMGRKLSRMKCFHQTCNQNAVRCDNMNVMTLADDK